MTKTAKPLQVKSVEDVEALIEHGITMVKYSHDAATDALEVIGYSAQIIILQQLLKRIRKGKKRKRR